MTLEKKPPGYYNQDRKILINTLEWNPKILDSLKSVPAFWQLGTKNDVKDISVGDLVSRYFGISQEKEPASSLSNDLNIGKAVLKKQCYLLLEVIRRWKFPNHSPVEGYLVDDRSGWNPNKIINRFETFTQMKKIFQQREDLDYFNKLLNVPLFNSENPPESVRNKIEAILAGDFSSKSEIPTIETFLRNYFGLRVKRKTLLEITNELGFSGPGIKSYLDGIILLINRRFGTNIPLSFQAEKSIKYAETFNTRLYRQQRAETVGLIPDTPGEETRVSDMITHLHLLNLPGQLIADLVNSNSICVNKHQAQTLSLDEVSIIDKRLRGVKSIDKFKHDRSEQAAQLLEKINNNQGENLRATRILKVLELIANGYSNSEIRRKLEFNSNTLISQIARQAKRELMLDSVFAREVEQIYLDVLGTAKPIGKIAPLTVRKINQRLYSPYKAYRESLSDQSQQRFQEKFTNYEKQILKELAQGKRAEEIAAKFNVKVEDISIDIQALLKINNFGCTTNQLLERENQLQVLKTINSYDAWEVWSLHFDSLEELKRLIEIVNDCILLPWKEAVEKHTADLIKKALSETRAIVSSITARQPTVWVQGDRSFFEHD